MTPDLGRPLPGLRVLAAFHASRPDVPLTYCLPQNVYEDSVAGLAASEGLGETLRRLDGAGFAHTAPVPGYRGWAADVPDPDGHLVRVHTLV